MGIRVEAAPAVTTTPATPALRRGLVVVATRRGSPAVLRMRSQLVPRPRRDEVVVRVLACPVIRPDVQARYGQTPFPPKVPFVPGYAVVGDVIELGQDVRGTRVGQRVGALTMVGGYAEYARIPARRLVPVPADVDPVEAVPVLINYLVAYQVMHRAGRVPPHGRVVVIGASGGIGTAFLQLGQLAELTIYGLASADKHDVLRSYGAVPIDYRTEDFATVVRRAEPQGVDAVFDGMAGGYVLRGLSLLRDGGRYVVYGNPGSRRALLRLLWQLLSINLGRNGRRLVVYGTTSSLRHRRPFEEDWADLFDLLRRGRIQPLVARRLPLAEAVEANRLLETGSVTGTIVLYTPAYEVGTEEGVRGDT